MLIINSFLQTAFRFIKSSIVTVTKKLYRLAVVLAAGGAVITVVTLTASGFDGSGKNAVEVYGETSFAEAEETAILTFAEAEPVTEANIQMILTDSNEKGRLLAGDLLMKEAQKKITLQAEKQEQIKQEEIQIQTRQEEVIHSSAVINYSDEDYQLLLKIVEAEAGICDEKGRILVANVIVNRVKSNSFPNTIREVVYQPSQFSPVSDGRLYKCTVTEETVKSVNRALAGEDYSEGALFFMNRSKSKTQNVKWFDGNLTYLFYHDKHDFYK